MHQFQSHLRHSAVLISARTVAQVVSALLVLPILLVSIASAQQGFQQTEGLPTPAGSFAVLTPQVWFSHIEKNGFSSPPPLVVPRGVATNPSQFRVTSQAESLLDPQWGASVAFGRLSQPWTLGIAVQYVSFETKARIVAKENAITGVVGPDFLFGVEIPVTPGERITEERVRSDRFDLDLALTYFVSDLIEDRLNLSAGVGLKSIYATATRQFINRPSPTGKPGPEFLYAKCNDGATSCRLTASTTVDDLFYGVTMPVTLAFYPLAGKDLLLSLSVTPFLGGETRDDHNVVYAIQLTGPFAIKPRRLDGTTFAYGVTTDVAVRYPLSERLALSGGGRVQFFRGHGEYLAWGPFVNVSIRFGGR